MKTFILTFKSEKRSQKRTIQAKDYLAALLAFWETRKPDEGFPVVTEVNGAKTADPDEREPNGVRNV